MKLLILGAGGIGGLFGGRLAQTGADVTFLVREKRKAQLASDGLRIESQFGNACLPVQARLQSEIEPRYDLVLLTCKAYDLPSAVQAIRPAMSPTTAVLPLLNGIAHIETLNAEFGKQRVMGGTARVQVTLTPDGLIKQLNDWQTVTFGEQDGSTSDRAATLKALLDKTVVEAKLSGNIMRELWLKLVHLSTVAGMTCLMRGNLGEIIRTPEGSDLLIKFFEANAEIAARAGHRPDDKFVNTYRDLFQQRDSRYEASMLRDLEKGGQIESEQILGFMLRQCRAAGLPDALHLAAYTHAKTFEQRRDAGRLPRPQA
ncbi:2-dehydropantoate 2-reductase [Ramlibacter sp.]|uniref:2-dehydropantoate 2-reductase n=1 Tax=Ramlibacter sp. TaxID=1917967 RepID=UPI002BF886C2|nr:2-dehydropantoate 2-reductase [Ramlibacter sp.]HWI83815.1 2-dehydropantoate 2-reductase [Ramlibacter sp.]